MRDGAKAGKAPRWQPRSDAHVRLFLHAHVQSAPATAPGPLNNL